MLYNKEGKLYATNYLEIYVPINYFTDGYAINKGSVIETLGIVYLRETVKGKDGDMCMLSLPTFIDLYQYESEEEEITINGKSLKVLTLKYLPDSFVIRSTIPQGREVAEFFLNAMLMGKLPNTLHYNDPISLWWDNLAIAGVDYKVPSKILEMIIASIYRSKSNAKKRFGQLYGKTSNGDGYNYKTGNVRDVVEGLSTFSGMVYEDMGRMITTGINNSIDGSEEPESPLEKIIHY